ncbi:MAG TPA: hypothetical protein VHF22_12975, partial [Planctomycetota bacterium]|nr:hypothetical protein [Planctomycetota bacterium]
PIACLGEWFRRIRRYSANSARTHVCLFLILAISGCASGESRQAAEKREAFEHEIVGRWVGEPVSPPAEVWFTHAKFDLWFSDQDDFSAVVSTYAGHPYDLRFVGEYRVKHADVLHVDERNLGGDWKVTRRTPDAMTLTRGDLTLALKRRYGT